MFYAHYDREHRRWRICRTGVGDLCGAIDEAVARATAACLNDLRSR